MKADLRPLAFAPVLFAISALGVGNAAGCLSDADAVDVPDAAVQNMVTTGEPDAAVDAGDDATTTMLGGDDDDGTPDSSTTPGDDDSSTSADSAADGSSGSTAAVAILRVGDGTTALTGTTTTTATFVDLYSTDGSLVGSIALPAGGPAGVASDAGAEAGTDAGAHYLTLTASSTEGYLALATDHSALFVAAHDVPPGVNLANDGGTVALGRIDDNAVLSLQTGVTGLGDPSNVRSVATIDGGVAWISAHDAVYALDGNRAATKITDLNSEIPREVAIFGSQLYVSSASTAAPGIFSVGTGAPTTAATAAILPGPVNSATYQYVLFDTDANGTSDLLYAASTDGVEKWTYSATAMKWSKVAATSLTAADGGAAGASGLTGRLDGTNVTLYATSDASSANAAFKLVDTAASAAVATVTPFASATSKTAFRGIAFVPGT